MICLQKIFSVLAPSKGFHIITPEVLKHFKALEQPIKTGIAHLFIHHTSASLTINENADPSVRKDFESHFNHMVPENQSYYIHTYEGPDDMPAHLKTSILGNSVSFPITNEKFSLGAWQGIYLCEHRDYPTKRNLTLTIYGN